MSDDALIRLGRSTLEAITGVLEMLAPGQVAPGDVTVVSDPFAQVPTRPWRRASRTSTA